MRLTPGRYRCRAHDHDLTDEVRAKVVKEPSVVASLGWRPGRKRMAKVGTFEVDVRCPDGANGGHLLRFRGSFET